MDFFIYFLVTPLYTTCRTQYSRYMSSLYSPDAIYEGKYIILKPALGTKNTQSSAYWSVFEKSADFSGNALGTVSALHKHSRDFLGHTCTITINLSASLKNRAFFSDILKIAEDRFFSAFSAAALAVANPEYAEYIPALEENGFSKAEKTPADKSIWWLKKASADDNFTVFPLTEHAVHISDDTGSFCTLVRGEKRALLIDTSWGTADFPAFLKKLVRTPFTVANTHGHPDHCFGNCLFDEVLTPENDRDVYEEIQLFADDRNAHFTSEKARRYYTALPFPPFKPLAADTVFDLGSVTVRTVPLYSHTHGSLGFLIEEDRLLAAGDAAGTFVWLFMKESLPLEQCINTYGRLLLLPFDRIVGSHAKVMWNKSIIRTVIANIRRTLAADYQFTDENFKEIMGYKTHSSFFCDKENSSWIVIKDRRFDE